MSYKFLLIVLQLHEQFKFEFDDLRSRESTGLSAFDILEVHLVDEDVSILLVDLCSDPDISVGYMGSRRNDGLKVALSIAVNERHNGDFNHGISWF